MRFLRRPYRDRAIEQERDTYIRAKAEAAQPKCLLCGSREGLSEIWVGNVKTYVCINHANEGAGDAGVQ